MKIDLHIHTTASDGTWDPAQLVAAAQAAGLGAIAVTDHDTVANVAATAGLAQAAGLQFIHGAEICATKNGHCFHILGYGLELDNRPLLELLAHNEALLAKKDEDSIALLAQEGWPVSLKEFYTYSYDRHRGGWKALAYLQDKGLCRDVQDFFTRIFTPEHNLGFPTFPSIGEVVAAIHGAGGVALCAHAASDFHGPGLEPVLTQLAEEPLDGFECYHSGHSLEDTQRLVAYCKARGLLRSGGSDCHGSFVPSRNLGEPLVTEAELYLPGLL